MFARSTCRKIEDQWRYRIGRWRERSDAGNRGIVNLVCESKKAHDKPFELSRKLAKLVSCQEDEVYGLDIKVFE